MTMTQNARKSYSPLKVRISLYFFFLGAACLGPGCSPDIRPMELKQIAKTDVDMVADAMFQETTRLMKDLMVKLYRRNPRELARGKGTTVEKRVSALFDTRDKELPLEMDQKIGIEAVLLCFDEAFEGDRVLALVSGLKDMIIGAYDGQEEFFVLSPLDQQKLYNSARNLEILVWRLSNKRKENGELFLLTNGTADGIPNLSFERLFGKMIAIQDMMARIMSDRTNRLINRIVISVATAGFLP